MKHTSLETKKEIPREALKTASEYGNAGVLLGDAVNAAPLEGQAGRRQRGGGSYDARLIRSSTPRLALRPRGTKAANIKAVKSADSDEAQGLITETIKAASDPTAKSAVKEAGPSPEALDQIWLFKVKTFGYVLRGAAGALVISVIPDIFFQVEPNHVQTCWTSSRPWPASSPAL